VHLASHFALNSIRIRFSGLQPKSHLHSFNGLFRRSLLPELAHEKALLETFSPQLYARLNEARLLGQLVFEYGTLVHGVSKWNGLTVLDIGSGGSDFPFFLAAQGAKVTTLELAEPVEQPAFTLGLVGAIERRALRSAKPAVTERIGTMFEIPAEDGQFDLVTSLSVIEHVDTSFPDRRYVPYEQQKLACARTLTEMVRVAKPGGYIYLTSECCDFTRATQDAWKPHYYYRDGPELSGAWPVQDVRRLFYEFLSEKGCHLVGPVRFEPQLVGEEPDCQSFRGRYWSAFTVFAQKAK
jgi:SAM-dependent methyltransferase